MPQPGNAYNLKPLSKWQLDTLSESAEKHRCICFGSGRFRIKFLDTMRFIASSLDKSVAAHLKNLKQDAAKAFPTMLKYHPDIVAKTDDCEKRALLDQLVRKLDFAYDFMDGPECWNAPPVPSKSMFYNSFRGKAIDDEAYIDLHNLAAMTGANTFEQTLVTYLSNDILQQADLLLSFRASFRQITQIDPLHYLGIAGAAFNGVLKQSKAKFELITKESMPGKQPHQLMELINGNISGGLSYAFIPHSVANNHRCADFDPSKPTIWLGSLDATNLYGWCMCQPLPVGEDEFEELPQTDAAALAMFHRLLDSYTPEQARGYMLEVEFDIAPEDHDDWDLAPVTRMRVLWEHLSPRQRELKWSRLSEDKRRRAQESGIFPKSLSSAHQKLIPYLGSRRQAISVAYALFLRSRKARFTKVYNIVSFRQARALKDVVEKNAALRKEANAKDDRTKSAMLKLINNSSYGYFGMKPDHGRV
jgi:hypothetical protein